MTMRRSGSSANSTDRRPAAPNAVRITGGTLRGRMVLVPKKARPTEGRVREALFSMWQEQLPGARVLDLFAGSGIVALEAISRGALAATCLEGDLAAVRLLETNCRKLAPGAVEVRRVTLPSGLTDFAAVRVGQYDLIFADPPYQLLAYDKLIAAVHPLLAHHGELVIEHSSRSGLPEEASGLIQTDRRRYGESCLSFFRVAQAA